MQDSDNPQDMPVKEDSSAKTKLIVVGRKLFAQQGLEGTSTRDIAKESGLNISLISYYFGGKEGLYKAVIAEFAAQASSRMTMLLGSLDLESLDRESFKKTMHGIVAGMIPMKVGEPDINMILHREMMCGMPHAKEIFDSLFVDVVERIVSLYVQGQKRGFVRKDINPHVVFLSLVHSTDAFVKLGDCETKMKARVPHLPEEMDIYIEQIYRIFVEGVMI